MREFEPHAGEHQPPHVIESREEAVVRPFAIGRITDDRVRQVRKVAAELMPASGLRPGGLTLRGDGTIALTA